LPNKGAEAPLDTHTLASAIFVSEASAVFVSEASAVTVAEASTLPQTRKTSPSLWQICKLDSASPWLAAAQSIMPVSSVSIGKKERKKKEEKRKKRRRLNVRCKMPGGLFH